LESFCCSERVLERFCCSERVLLLLCVIIFNVVMYPMPPMVIFKCTGSRCLESYLGRTYGRCSATPKCAGVLEAVRSKSNSEALNAHRSAEDLKNEATPMMKHGQALSHKQMQTTESNDSLQCTFYKTHCLEAKSVRSPSMARYPRLNWFVAVEIQC
jgi:hypothetical protein